MQGRGRHARRLLNGLQSARRNLWAHHTAALLFLKPSSFILTMIWFLCRLEFYTLVLLLPPPWLLFQLAAGIWKYVN